MLHGLAEPPVLEGIVGRELIEEDGHPKDDLVRNLAGFVSQVPLREKSTRPASENVQGLKLRFWDSPFLGTRKSFVRGIPGVGDGVHDEDVESHPWKTQSRPVESETRLQFLGELQCLRVLTRDAERELGDLRGPVGLARGGVGGCEGVECERVVLPAGPMSTLFQSLEESTLVASPPSELGAPRPRWEDRSQEGWGGLDAWTRWTDLVRLEAEARNAPGLSQNADALQEQARRRVQLALLAKDQGRDADAWSHLISAGRSPLVLTALPALLDIG